MNARDIDAAIARLQEAGADVGISYRPKFARTQSHVGDVRIAPEECGEFVTDPVGFVARHWGISREQYQGWLEAEGALFCAARTKQGHRCRCTVTGCSYGSLAPLDWVRREAAGEYCATHGGPAA